MLNHLQKMTVTETRLMILFGVVCFIYALSAGMLVQVYLIPKVFPNFDLGDGLLVQDSSGFNSIAKVKSAEILAMGWGAWELRPQGQSPAGVASVFYALWTPKPYSLLPFNALVHALSGCAVLWVLRHFFSWKAAMLGTAFFILNPASLEWVAQIHRDGIYILGNLLALICLLQFQKGLLADEQGTILWGLLWGMLGTVLVWIGRPHWVQVMLLATICVIPIVIYGWLRRRQDAK